MGITATIAIHDRLKVVPRNLTRYLLAIKLVAVGSVITCPFWLGALFFTSPEDYSFSSSLICVPLLAIVGAAAVVHFTQNDPYIRRLFMAGLVAHMAASSVFLWVGFFIYGGAVDAFHYWTVGMQLADQFQFKGWAIFQPPYWSTNLINNICGITALMIGDALPTLFIAFALIPLAGAYLFYRAFIMAFPDGDRWLFGLLAVLSPSLVFWSSFIGKDSLIQYFIALTCFGFARLTQRPGFRSVLFCAIGLAGALLIRAHIAAMLALAMTFPYVVGKSRAGASKAAKIILIPILVGGTSFLVIKAQSFLHSNLNSNNSTSVFQEADTVTKNSQIGGSSFNQGASLPVRVAESPFLLFRPFPWEMNNVMALAPAVESIGLMFLCWSRRREIWSTLRHWRDPYVGFLLMYSMIFLITFGGAISNFGILLRQRIMLTPLVLMLICAKQKPLIRSTHQMSRGNLWPTRVAGAAGSNRIPTGA
jgi:hypothetical protein